MAGRGLESEWTGLRLCFLKAETALRYQCAAGATSAAFFLVTIGWMAPPKSHYGSLIPGAPIYLNLSQLLCDPWETERERDMATGIDQRAPGHWARFAQLLEIIRWEMQFKLAKCCMRASIAISDLGVFLAEPVLARSKALNDAATALRDNART
jgi:hypothetical protein